MNVTECSLLNTIKAADPVFGLAIIDKKLYVLRQRKQKQIYVYTGDNYDLSDDYITIPELEFDESGWNDMTECEQEKCLFVSDFKAKCIHKVCLKEGPKVSKFAQVKYPPKGLSITPEGTLLVSCDPNKLVELDVKTGKQVCEVDLHSDIQYPKHAIKREDKQYLVAFDVQNGLHRVCIVGADGYLRHAYGGMAGSGDLQLHTPCYMALCSNDHVAVADNDNGRIVLLNSALEFVRYVLDFQEPHRLYFDKDSSRFFVGECTNGNLKIFKVAFQLPK